MEWGERSLPDGGTGHAGRDASDADILCIRLSPSRHGTKISLGLPVCKGKAAQDALVKLADEKQHGYLVAVALTDKYVVTYEAWGPIEAFRIAEDAIRKSISTLRL